jgi:hypothetical protein
MIQTLIARLRSDERGIGYVEAAVVVFILIVAVVVLFHYV